MKPGKVGCAQKAQSLVCACVNWRGWTHFWSVGPSEMEGWFATDQVIDMPVDQDVLTGKSGPESWESCSWIPLLSSSMRLSWELALVEGCGLLADGQTCQSINHSRIRRDCVCLSGLPVAGSPHRRSRSLSLRGQGEVCLKLARSREQGGSGCWSLVRLVRPPRGGRSGLVLMAWPFWDRNRRTPAWGKLLRGSEYSGIEGGARASASDSSYLVDPDSSHMLVSKIKPCMSKYKQICTVKLRMAH